jgi:DNA-binding transcriptional ArsR family regulator
MVDPGLVFGALADDTRRTVFVRVAAGGQATASELARDLPVTRQAVAKHLSLLASAGLVERERVGREIRFSARAEPLSEAIEWMANVGARWDDRLARLASLAG